METLKALSQLLILFALLTFPLSTPLFAKYTITKQVSESQVADSMEELNTEIKKLSIKIDTITDNKQMTEIQKELNALTGKIAHMSKQLKNMKQKREYGKTESGNQKKNERQSTLEKEIKKVRKILLWGFTLLIILQGVLIVIAFRDKGKSTNRYKRMNLYKDKSN